MKTPTSEKLRALIVKVHALGTRLQQTEIGIKEMRETCAVVHHELKILFERTHTGTREKVTQGLRSPSGLGRASFSDLRSQIEDSVSILRKVAENLEPVEDIDLDDILSDDEEDTFR